MKRIAFSALVLLVTACGQKDGAMPTGLSNAKKEDRSIESRVRELDSFIAKDGEPEPADVISPVLTRRAVKELSSRISGAKNIEAKIRFVGRVLAIVTVTYTVGTSDASREQEIEFLYANRQWMMHWPTMTKKPEANQSLQPTAPSGRG
jgi:hypothetical protein